ncbi:unnamed protein product [Symbiodinium sp. CCMP2592]|nr:unnamed protein product [Symbiodinium sp. CCMP2592]
MSVALYASDGHAGQCGMQEEDYSGGVLLALTLGIVAVIVGTQIWCSRSIWGRLDVLTFQLEQLTTAVRQIQALVHVENDFTRSRSGEHARDAQARIQAVMNKLMRTAEEVASIHAMHANMGNTLRSHQLELQKLLLQSKRDVEATLQQVRTKLGEKVGGVTTDVQAILDKAIESAASKSDSVVESMKEQIKSEYASVITFLSPLKRSQEQFTTAMGSRFNDVLKEVANAAYNLTKQGKDTAAQARWIQHTVDNVQTHTDHLPDKMNFIRSLLENMRDSVEQIQKDIAALDAERAEAGSPVDAPGEPVPDRDQWSRASPSPPPPVAPPTMLNLDESLPVQMTGTLNRQSYLMPIGLPDGRTVFIPRGVLQQMLGPTQVM